MSLGEGLEGRPRQFRPDELWQTQPRMGKLEFPKVIVNRNSLSGRQNTVSFFVEIKRDTFEHDGRVFLFFPFFFFDAFVANRVSRSNY